MLFKSSVETWEPEGRCLNVGWKCSVENQKYSSSALLVLNETSLNSVNTVLALSRWNANTENCTLLGKTNRSYNHRNIYM